MKELMLLKVIAMKNVWFSTIVFNHGFNYQYSVCNGCHILLMQCVNISNIAIITHKGADCFCIINDISKSDVINLLKNYVRDDIICTPKKLILKIECATIILTI